MRCSWQLLTREPTNRLGTGPGGPDEIKRHSFFQGTDFDGMLDGRVPAPWQPSVVVRLVACTVFSSLSHCPFVALQGSADTSQFDKEFTSMAINSPPSQEGQMNPDDRTFTGFTFMEAAHLPRHFPPSL
jgi:hypothetical protein